MRGFAAIGCVSRTFQLSGKMLPSVNAYQSTPISCSACAGGLSYPPKHAVRIAMSSSMAEHVHRGELGWLQHTLLEVESARLEHARNVEEREVGQMVRVLPDGRHDRH